MFQSIAPSDCARCAKPAELCVCDSLPRLDTRLHTLILQHPQEPDKELGTARLAHLSLSNSTLRVGLSWPNLRAALGRDAENARWAVLYLGSGARGPLPPDSALCLLDKHGVPLPSPKAPAPLDGIVVLDGTWSQAKTLWWRNAWLLKLRRAVLRSPRTSLYRGLRKEPRNECLSTIESIAEALVAAGEPAATGDALRGVFQSLLDRYRAAHPGRSMR